MNNSEGHNKYEELKKRRYLRIGVISFTIIIATLWIMSIRLSFVKSPDETSAREPLISKSFKADVRNIISLDKNDLTATEINQKYFSPEEKSFLEDMAKDLESKELETPNDRLRAAEEKMIVDFNDRISEKK